MKKNLLGYMISLLLAAAVFAGVLPAEAYADALFAENELPEITIEPSDYAPADVGTREDEGDDVIPESSISDGLYIIEPALSPELVLEIQNDSLENKGNAALGQKTGDFRQAFYIESCGEDVYTVRNYYSGLVLDVMGGMSANGTNIQQYQSNGSAAQKWKIAANKDGTVTFTCAKNGKAMDVAGGKAAAGTNVRIYSVNGTAAQSWRLTRPVGVTEVFEKLEDSDLEDGYYRIVSAKNGGMCLGIAGGSRALCANAALYAVGGDAADIFKVTKLGGGLSQITAPHSGMVLDLLGGMIKNGTNIRQYTGNGTAAQQWYIKKDPATGFYAILSGKNMMTAADVQGGLTSPGTNVRAYRFNGTKAQFWQFKKTDTAGVGDKIRMEGIFRILPASDPSLALTVAGAGTGNGANVELGRCGSGNEQLFSFSKFTDGTWTLRNLNSGKVIDIAGGSRRSGANIQQYTLNGTAAQKFEFIPTGRADNSYTIRVYGTLAFDIVGGKIAAGTNVRLYTPNGTPAQSFILEAASPENGWIYDSDGRRWYYKDGRKLTGWQTVGGKTYYIDAANGLRVSQVVDGWEVDANGVRGRRVRTLYTNTVNGKRTLKTFLQNAMVPVGRTLYIWGGGWGGMGNSFTTDTAKIGYLPGWQAFYDANATASYDYKKTRWSYGCGLDCSGYVAWAVYNTMYTANNLKDLVIQSTSVAPEYIKWGWAYQDMSSYRPGDVVSMSGHVWISLGKCSDGTVLLVHSSPNGVQISGTGGKSTQLADKYMKILAPDWPYATRTVNYPSQTTSKATWIVNGRGALTDPDRMQGMSAEEVLRTLFGS